MKIKLEISYYEMCDMLKKHVGDTMKGLIIENMEYTSYNKTLSIVGEVDIHAVPSLLHVPPPPPPQPVHSEDDEVPL